MRACFAAFSPLPQIPYIRNPPRHLFPPQAHERDKHLVPTPGPQQTAAVAAVPIPSRQACFFRCATQPVPYFVLFEIQGRTVCGCGADQAFLASVTELDPGTCDNSCQRLPNVSCGGSAAAITSADIYLLSDEPEGTLDLAFGRYVWRGVVAVYSQARMVAALVRFCLRLIVPFEWGRMTYSAQHSALLLVPPSLRYIPCPDESVSHNMFSIPRVPRQFSSRFALSSAGSVTSTNTVSFYLVYHL